MHKAFVSSTFQDLEQHREHVIRQLRRAGLFVDPMEDWTAASDEPKVFSTERIRDCDLFVLLVARRRGHVPAGESKSITQLEYEFAREQGLPVLVFLLGDDVGWPPPLDETANDPELVAWRAELCERHGVEFFGPEPASIDIAPAIARWLTAPANGKRDLDEPLKQHLEAVVRNLEQRREEFTRDVQRNLLDFYIDARGSAQPPPRGSEVEPGADRLFDLLMPSVEGRQPSIVLADFGMGKTWFLEHLRYSLAKTALANGVPDPPIPIWLSLRGATQEKALFRELRRQAWTVAFGEHVTESSEDVLVQLYEAGRFVFLFDALDEMRMISVSPEDRERILSEIGSLRESVARSPVILTCRRSFFTDAASERRLPDLGFDVFYLWPWSRDDIVSYLRKLHAGGALDADPDVVIDTIEQNYDLRDISSRAMLSAMLADQWESLAGTSIDMPSLFERHVEKAVLDWNAPKAWRLERHELKTIMEEIAFLMFRLDSLEISPSELDDYFSKKLAGLGVGKFSEVAESLVRDIRTNSLLMRAGDSYTFCHTSIWEYMVARRLVRELAEGISVPSRGSQYESIFQNFLVPMLRSEGRLDLVSSVFPGGAG